MVFSSEIFLFLFLPLVLLAYYVVKPAWRNTVLLVFSLGFYAWGEGIYVLLMLCSIAFNFGISRLMQRAKAVGRRRLLSVGVAGNLLALFLFKYATFMLENAVLLLSGGGEPMVNVPAIHLPIGISFFTFQAMSFLFDVYGGTVQGVPRFFDCALYICLFPQLIAGPIVRYHHVAQQILSRRVDVRGFSSGVQRFIQGLAKKVLLADSAGLVADQIFGLSIDRLTPELAWLAVFAYTLQIYFDFSGYSDMAIGLGRMFGFRFQENFYYPYIARSIREFWRRWHISLSTWFRDYLYFPLGGSRCSPVRTYFNLWIVFVLCGFWHGAGWNFLIWGMLHGVYLVLERAGLGRILDRLWRPLQHIYVLLLVMISWVFFRSESLGAAWQHLKAMMFMTEASIIPAELLYLTVPWRLFLLVVAGVFCVPIGRKVNGFVMVIRERSVSWKDTAMVLSYYGALLVLLILTISSIASNAYKPFIYFRF